MANIQLPAGSVVEYKYVLVNYESKAAMAWQSGGNSVLAIDVDERMLEVEDNWQVVLLLWQRIAGLHQTSDVPCAVTRCSSLRLVACMRMPCSSV